MVSSGDIFLLPRSRDAKGDCAEGGAQQSGSDDQVAQLQGGDR
ncbi:MAG: hypothetical protein H6R18_1098, partial [Proteobacteria bacterium]|nr:hypothetical protein [Pseudomonadota bacterium]